MSALPPDIDREDWLQALPRALVAGFVKADIDFQRKGEVSGTTATLVVIDGFTVTVASVGDSRCILDTQGGELQLLTVDHHLEENAEEREHVTASGGEVGRLNLFGGQEVGPLRCWPGGLCLSRSIRDRRWRIKEALHWHSVGEVGWRTGRMEVKRAMPRR
uniref:protein-serine/threonine phosphatase n=3 Tax=Zea mays TaxID=4577 RepID=A0A804M2J3_MAIZE